MEFADSGDITGQVEKNKDGIGESKARYYFRQIADGINYMHSRGFAHRDLKLENILLCKSEADPASPHLICKITDFGLSSIAWTSHSGIVPMDSPTGTRRYMSPEYAWHLFMDPHREPKLLPTPTVVPTDERQGQPDHMAKMGAMMYKDRQAYIEKNLKKLEKNREKVKLFREFSSPMAVSALPADVWTMGVALFAMITGKYPFIVDHYPVGLDLLITGRYIKYKNIPADVHELLRELFEPDPVKRITTKGILYHKWLNVKDSNYPVPQRTRKRSPSKSKAQPQVQPQPQTPAGPSRVKSPPAVTKTPSKEHHKVAEVEVHRKKSPEGHSQAGATKLKTPSFERKKSSGQSPGASGTWTGGYPPSE
jgi:serine/threonine protein kinase